MVEFDNSRLLTEAQIKTLDKQGLCEYVRYIYDDKGYLMELMKETFGDVLTEKDMKSGILSERKRALDGIEEYYHLNEADSPNPGHDPSYWIPNLGWLGGLAAAGLAALLGVIGKLLMAGKQQIAILLLRRYMKKLVELTDDGIKKRRFLWHERNRTCLRSLQENCETVPIVCTLSAAKAMGMIESPDNLDQLGGLTKFKDIVQQIGMSVSIGDSEDGNVVKVNDDAQEQISK